MVQANTANRLSLNRSKSWSKVTIRKPAASAVAAKQASVHKRLGSGAASEPKKLCKCASKRTNANMVLRQNHKGVLDRRHGHGCSAGDQRTRLKALLGIHQVAGGQPFFNQFHHQVAQGLALLRRTGY